VIDHLYAEELRWLREAGKAFAARHPQAAAQLAASSNDPDVERLLEGVAFLGARTRARAEAADGELVQALVLALAPHLVRPWPAMAMLRLAHVPGMNAQVSVPAGTLVESSGSSGLCRFRTAWEAAPAWAEVATTRIEAGDPPRLELHLAVRPTGSDRPTRLRLHCHGETGLAASLRYALLASRRVVAVLPGGTVVPLSVSTVGFSPQEALIPACGSPGHGHMLLAQLAAFPIAFNSIELSGPPRFGLPDQARDLRVVVELATASRDLAGVTPGNLLGGCVPVVNLWPASADPLTIDGTTRERLLTIDGGDARPWAIRSVVGATRGGTRRPWPHLTDAPGPGVRWQEVRRAAPGGGASELWLAHALPDLASEVLSIDVLAHDGARAAALGIGDICVPTGGMPSGVVFANLDRPTAPHEPVLDGALLRRLALRLRCAAGGLRRVEDLRALLELDDPRDPTVSLVASDRIRRSAALRTLAVTACAEPFAGAAVRTLRHEIEVDEDAVGGIAAAVLLGEVIERMLAQLAPLNTATSLTMRCQRGGRTQVFPARIAGASA
jgi:type VI secretion system protein ImpG